jgi:archaemetzincin
MPMLASEIKLVAIGDVDREILDYLTLTLPGTFGVRCVEIAEKLDPAPAYNSARRQYHSTQLLQHLYDMGDPTSCGKILGVTEVDLFIPIFTFVFGEAQVGGTCALMSAHRLQQRFYGLPDDRARLLERAEKEATHELGHAYGLAHCRSLECVMRFSNSVEEVDLKAIDFCRLCEANLRSNSESTLAA